MAAKPFHGGAGEEIAFRVFCARGKARVLFCIREISGDVGDGIDQQLRGQSYAGVAAGDRGGGRRLPPALSPATPTRRSSPPNAAMRAITSLVAAKASSKA